MVSSRKSIRLEITVSTDTDALRCSVAFKGAREGPAQEELELELRRVQHEVD